MTLLALLEQLNAALQRIRYDGGIDLDGLATGDAAALLPLLHYTLLRYSGAVARWLEERGYDLYGKNDLRFMETVYRLARVELGYRHTLTCKQLLATGFAEHKVRFMLDLIALCRSKHDALATERLSRTNRAAARQYYVEGTARVPAGV